jgi:hypothetical protein
MTMSHQLKEKEKLLSKNRNTMFAGKSFLIRIDTTSITSFISFYGISIFIIMLFYRIDKAKLRRRFCAPKIINLSMGKRK